MKLLLSAALSANVFAACASVVGNVNDFVDDSWKASYGVRICGPEGTTDFAKSDFDGDGWSMLDEFMAMTHPGAAYTAFPGGGICPEHPVPQISVSVCSRVPCDGVPLVIRMAPTNGWGMQNAPATWTVSGEEERTMRFDLADMADHGEPIVLSCSGARPGEISIAVYAIDGTVITNAFDSPGDRMSGRIGNFFRTDYVSGLSMLDVPRMIMSLKIPREPAYASVTWKDHAAGLYRGHVDLTLIGPSSGQVRSGRNLIEVYADKDLDGQYTPGEPYGCADLDVGWFGGSTSVELTYTSPVVPRINISAMDGIVDFESANALTDRGVRGSYYANVAAYMAGTNPTIRAATRVRVVRSLVNGDWTLNGENYNEVVLDRTLDLGAHTALTEAEVLADGKFDLDWETLRAAWIRAHVGTANMTQLTNATYRVVLGDGSVGNAVGEANNNLSVLFVNAFEAGSQQTAAQPVSPAGTVFAGQPTFRWSHNAVDAVGKKIKDYPAFRLRVWKDRAKSSLVYDSGVQAAPPRDASNVYSWTAPIYADMVTPKGVVFATTNNYFWSVSMLDAKFMSPNAAETVQEFRMETSASVPGYGSIDVHHDYAGKSSGRVIACAYKRPDFSGAPEGMSSSEDENDVRIIGLVPGRYFVRAFVDVNTNCMHDAGEPSGFVSGNDGRPAGITVGASITECAVTIYDTPNQEQRR